MQLPTKTNVLYLEDDADSRELVAYTLLQAGINVISAETVAEARELALTPDVDLYLLDGLIPNGDSLKLCRDLRSLHPSTPIVFYSGLAFKEDILRGLAAGATAYLVKPFSGDLGEEILRFIHNDYSSNSIQPLFLDIETVMQVFESEAESDDEAFRAEGKLTQHTVGLNLIQIRLKGSFRERSIIDGSRFARPKEA